MLSMIPQSYALQLLTMPTELSLLTLTVTSSELNHLFSPISLRHKRKSWENCEVEDWRV